MQSRLCFRLLWRQEIVRRPFDNYSGKIEQKKETPPFNVKLCQLTKTVLEIIIYKTVLQFVLNSKQDIKDLLNFFSTIETHFSA